MSVDYAAGLSHYDDLGDCGLDEVVDKLEEVREKVKLLASWLRHYKGSCVVHVGAGISTSAGIRDFRGKHGVWTELQQQSQKGPKSQEVASGSSDKRRLEEGVEIAPTATTSTDLKLKLETEDNAKTTKPFDQTEPTFTHMALKELCNQQFVKHIISQNVDGLFVKANLPRKFISELHGNFYLDECTKCRSRFIRASASQSMRLTKSSFRCPRGLEQCKGYLRDTILDWESPIPFNELRTATKEGKQNLLHICIGTSMQLRPSKDIVCDPTNTNKRRDCSSSKGGIKRLVVINLQPTKLDQKANLVINYYADEVMRELANQLELEVPAYDSLNDPTKDLNLIGTMWKK